MALTLENINAMTKDEIDALIEKYPHLEETIEKLKKEDSNE